MKRLLCFFGIHDLKYKDIAGEYEYYLCKRCKKIVKRKANKNGDEK